MLLPLLVVQLPCTTTDPTATITTAFSAATVTAAVAAAVATTTSTNSTKLFLLLLLLLPIVLTLLLKQVVFLLPRPLGTTKNTTDNVCTVYQSLIVTLSCFISNFELFNPVKPTICYIIKFFLMKFILKAVGATL